ncbi:AbrB/MazE/SpoVT family DNA-binding domain-containing protein [Breznakiellaceae bacterium SP9]
MSTVILSSKYQIVIPKEIRNAIGLTAGTHLEIMVYNNRIELIPLIPIQKMKGIFKGMDTSFVRDEEDRV